VSAPDTATPYASYQDLVNDASIDIIYIATPHSHHYAHTHLALSAGKHVLVEKPLTVNAAQSRALFALAREKNRFLMEAVWTRFFPLTREIQDFIASGRLGTVKRVFADLSFWNNVEAEFGTQHRMVNMQLAGGALLDLGVYSLTWVFLVLYHLQQQHREKTEGGEEEKEKTKPTVKAAMSLYSATGCDEMTSIVLDFPAAHIGADPTAEDQDKGNGDAHALALTNIRVSDSPNATHPSADPVRIQGTLGDITVSAPCYRPLSYTLTPASNAHRGTPAAFEYQEIEHEIPGGGHGMFWEADECARCIRDGKLESSVMGWGESEAVMEVMDEVRRQGGLVYPEEIEGLDCGEV
jgi:predicted dehydrogenase